MDFTRYDVGLRESLDSVVPAGRRRGVYILEFDDGERYVGQAVDVVRRFTAHRRRWSDIRTVAFSFHPTGDLDALEQSLIHQQQAEYQLRNLRFARGPNGPSPLDVVVSPSRQDAWLAADPDDDADLGDGPRNVTDTARERGRRAWERMAARPNSALAVEVVSAYVHAVLPRPCETEGRFWGVSAAPSTGASGVWRRLAAVSVHSMETFVVGETPLAGRDDDWCVRGSVVVSRGELESRCGTRVEDLALGRAPVLTFLPPGYEAAGDDDVAIHWSGTVESLAALDELPWVEAGRALAVRLMRKGLSLQRRWHNVPLADAVFARDRRSTAPGVSGAADRLVRDESDRGRSGSRQPAAAGWSP